MVSRRWLPVVLIGLVPFMLAPGCGGASGVRTTFEVNDGAEKGPAGQPDKPAPNDEAGTIPRKIVYTGTLEIRVKDFDETVNAITSVLENYKGYIAKSDMTIDIGSRRQAKWTLKVPVDQFRPAMNALAALGTTLRNSTDSQDVTEEFVDVTARVKNLKQEEDALNKLMKDASNSLADVLKLRDQIKNVRGDIERAEGRLKFLSSNAALSTINLSIREDSNYQPTPPTAGPSFADQIGSRFGDSWQALTNLAKDAFLLLVGLAPWSPVILVVVLVLRWGFRRIQHVFNTPEWKPSHAANATLAKAKPVQRPVGAEPLPTDAENVNPEKEAPNPPSK